MLIQTCVNVVLTSYLLLFVDEIEASKAHHLICKLTQITVNLIS